MKPISIFLMLFLVKSSFALGQEIKFKSRFLPEKTYITSVSTDSRNILNLEGPEDRINELKEKGIGFPIEILSKTSMKTEMKNGKKENEESFPFTILYDSIKNTTIQNGITKEIENPLTGLIIEGFYKSNGQLEVSNLISDKINDATKKTLKTTLETVTQSIPFPDYPMKIGDSFNQVIPMVIPIADVSNVKITISTIYTLRELKGDLAFFDLIQSIALDMDQESATIVAEGNGSGKAVYNTKYNFIAEYGTGMKMKISIGIEDLIIANELEINTNQKVKIY